MQLRQLHPVAESHAMRRSHQHFVVDLEVLDEDVEHAPRHAFLDLEQGWRAVPQLAQALVDRFEQVVGFVFLNHHVGVADDAEDVRALDGRAGEQRLDVGADDVFDEDEGDAVAGERRRQRDEARQHRRQLDARELGTALVLDRHREVLAAVRDVRETDARDRRPAASAPARARAGSTPPGSAATASEYSVGSRNLMPCAASSGLSASFQHRAC